MSKTIVTSESIEWVKAVARLSRSGGWVLPSRFRGKTQRCIEEVMEAKNSSAKDKIAAVRAAAAINSQANQANSSLLCTIIKKEEMDFRKHKEEEGRGPAEFDMECFEDQNEFDTFADLLDKASSGQKMTPQEQRTFGEFMARALKSKQNKSQE